MQAFCSECGTHTSGAPGALVKCPNCTALVLVPADRLSEPLEAPVPAAPASWGTPAPRALNEPAPVVPPTRLSAYAVIALIAGLLGCVPPAAITACILGVLALRELNRDPGLRGRGLAIAGLSLGFLSLAGWVFFAAWVLSQALST